MGMNLRGVSPHIPATVHLKEVHDKTPRECQKP
jgi:hypothetical protein